MAEEIEIKKKKPKGRWGVYLGGIFILIGAVWLLVALGIIPGAYLRFWPQVLLIITGILILIKSLG
ncbi:MAG: hypothetical protein RBT32_05235 [Methanothermobacter sp.]|nr:hypothetical protein [Methanothermobacter sp.]HOQ19733.1 hypothetical protein [Methanothermobacter sp.]